jgi:hypothetical protein
VPNFANQEAVKAFLQGWIHMVGMPYRVCGRLRFSIQAGLTLVHAVDCRFQACGVLGWVWFVVLGLSMHDAIYGTVAARAVCVWIGLKALGCIT